MLTFQDFFSACAGYWTTERTYHFVLQDKVERSHTEFRVTALEHAEKQQILSSSFVNPGLFTGIKIDATNAVNDGAACPGFAIAFDTRSETGEEVSMSLKALFIPDRYVDVSELAFDPMPLPGAAQVKLDAQGELIQGLYLRDQGYSEMGAIAGRFSYQSVRQTLEMTTYYNRSVAVDQMRLVAPNLRLRTIVTYQRPVAGVTPTVIDLIGVGVERKQTEL